MQRDKLVNGIRFVNYFVQLSLRILKNTEDNVTFIIFNMLVLSHFFLLCTYAESMSMVIYRWRRTLSTRHRQLPRVFGVHSSSVCLAPFFFLLSIEMWEKMKPYSHRHTHLCIFSTLKRRLCFNALLPCIKCMTAKQGNRLFYTIGKSTPKHVRIIT